MKTIILIAIAVLAVATIATTSFAQTTSASDVEIQAKPIGYVLVPTGEGINFIQFNEFYSDYYKEVYDQKGNLLDVVTGTTVYVYKTKKFKCFPVFNQEDMESWLKSGAIMSDIR